MYSSLISHNRTQLVRLLNSLKIKRIFVLVKEMRWSCKGTESKIAEGSWIIGGGKSARPIKILILWPCDIVIVLQNICVC